MRRFKHFQIRWMESKHDEDTHDTAPVALRLLYACSAWMILLAACPGTNEKREY